jgi:hypothetical protein
VPNRAEALILFTVKQVGVNTVVVTGSGSYNTTGLTYAGDSLSGPFGYPANPFLVDATPVTRQGLASGANFLLAGTSNASAYLWYASLTRTSDLGVSGVTIDAVASSGTVAGIDESYYDPRIMNSSLIVLPSGVACTSPLTCTIANISSYSGTIASLGLTPGTYTWTWGASEDQKLTINVEAPGPLPALGAATAFGWSRRLRRRIRGATDASALSASTPLKGQTPADG